MTTDSIGPDSQPRTEAADAESGGLQALRVGLVVGAIWMLLFRQIRRISPDVAAGQDGNVDALDWEREIARLERHVNRHSTHGRRPGFLASSFGGSAELVGSPAAVQSDAREAAVRQLCQGTAALSFSILADSAMEHYRGGFYNPTMYLAPIIAGLTLGVSSSAARKPPPLCGARSGIFTAAVLTGLAGFGFHLWNTTRRIGGWSWDNLFYGPPVAAPLGLTSAGLLGLAAGRIRSHTQHDRAATLLGRPAGLVIATGVAAGLLGTVAEAGLLHFRGAFQRPGMYLPVSVPPLAALALACAARRPTAARRRLARALLRATTGVGIAGVGFHAQGIQRSMGGWRNWSQNLLTGPPLPAPPSFTGIALAGLAALALLEEHA